MILADLPANTAQNDRSLARERNGSVLLSTASIPRAVTAASLRSKENNELSSQVRLLEQFAQIQFAAYCDRLDLQPGGAAIKAQALKNQSQAGHKMLRLSIGQFALDGLRELGQDTLLLLRAYGESLLACPAQKVALKPGQRFEEHIVTGVVNQKGERLYLSPRVIATIANIFHGSWERSLQQRTSATLSGVAMSGFLPTGDLSLTLNPKIINGDCLTTIMLCKQFAKLSESDFQSILQSATPGNPKKLDLNFQLVTSDSGFHQEINAPVAVDHRARITSLEAEFLDPIFKHAAIKIRTQLKEFEQTVVAQEARSILPVALNCINQMDTKTDADFETLCQQLKQIRLARNYWLQGLKFSAESRQELIVPKAGDFSPDTKQDRASQILINLEDRYRRTTKKITEPLAPSLESLRLISSEEEFRPHQVSIELLLRSMQQDASSEVFAKEGGILCNYYHKGYWSSLFESQGRILTYHDENGLKGLIVFYQPGLIPSDNSFVPNQFTYNSKVAYTELIVVAPDRPSGTFHKLFRGMLACLQLTSAEFSEGFIYANNRRSQSASQHFGYFMINIDSISTSLSNGQVTESLPIRIPVDPEMRQALGGLSSALASTNKELYSSLLPAF